MKRYAVRLHAAHPMLPKSITDEIVVMGLNPRDAEESAVSTATALLSDNHMLWDLLDRSRVGRKAMPLINVISVKEVFR